MIGSIFIRHDPVTAHEQYLLNLVPENAKGIAEAYFSAPSPAKRADGGLWQFRFRIHARENVLKELYENGLGRPVEAWGDGLQQIFEGKLWTIIYTLWPDQYTVSLDTITNRIFMRTDYDDDASIERTTVLTNDESDGRFGTKEIVLSGGQTQGLSVADQAVQQYLDLKAFPRPEADIGTVRGSQEYLDVIVKGTIHTLDWRVYNQTALTGNQGMSAQITDMLETAGMAEFIDSYDIDTNATPVTKEHDSDRGFGDIVKNMVGLGDNENNRWLLYVHGRSVTEVSGSKLRVRQAAPAIAPPAA